MMPGVDGRMESPAPLARMWYNRANRCPATPGSIGYLTKPVILAGATGFLHSPNTVRHSSRLPIRSRIATTTPSNAHVAITVCASIGRSFSRRRRPDMTEHRAHCSAREGRRGAARKGLRHAVEAPRPDRRERPRNALRPRTQSGHNAHQATSFYLSLPIANLNANHSKNSF